MSASTLREKLKDWTDADGAAYELACCLGLMNYDTDSMGKAKHVFWSQNRIGGALYNILRELVRVGVLEYRDEPDYQYRWNENFKGSWE